MKNIIKFEGLDGCGKSTLIDGLMYELSEYNISKIREFGSDSSTADSKNLSSFSNKIRKLVLDETNNLDELEKEFLWTLISRRTNRIIIPDAIGKSDIIFVDRSEESNYAYGTSIDPGFRTIYDLAFEKIPLDYFVFWIDCPVEICMERVSKRSLKKTYIEKKGYDYFCAVRKQYQQIYNERKNVKILDGTLNPIILVRETATFIRERFFGANQK